MCVRVRVCVCVDSRLIAGKLLTDVAADVIRPHVHVHSGQHVNTPYLAMYERRSMHAIALRYELR